MNRELPSSLIRCRMLASEVPSDVATIVKIFSTELSGSLRDVFILGGTFARSILANVDDVWFLVCLNTSLSKALPPDIAVNCTTNKVADEVYEIKIDSETLKQLCLPRVLLIALAHTDIFPLPRFSLNISCLAEALRENFSGDVTLADMQLGETIESIVSRIFLHRYDIVGISVSFGQADLLCELIHSISSMPESSPLIIIGGSLAALNCKTILLEHPHVFVSLGYGERTIVDFINYWRGDLPINDVQGVAYVAENGDLLTNPFKDEADLQVFPALDLLDATLGLNGAVQLETSRGCAGSCSFCPRSHKGAWRGISTQTLRKIVKEINKMLDANSITEKRIFLVDEEWIGPDNDKNINRILELASIFHDCGVYYETSCRIDQVWNFVKSTDWHVNRSLFWRSLVKLNLRRVLIGIESGVDEVLLRLGKGTVSLQNLYGVRLLTALGVPLRLTYIVFDPLMTRSELVSTYKFLGRTDIILQELSHMSEAELVYKVKSDAFSEMHSKGVPFYHLVPYMLVSLECFDNASYLHSCSSESEKKKFIRSMGKYQVQYQDLEVGMASHCCQLWIDRNFTLDYTLKSFQKVVLEDTSIALNKLRTCLKDHSYELLGKLIFIITKDASVLTNEYDRHDLHKIASSCCNSSSLGLSESSLGLVLDLQFGKLVQSMTSKFDQIKPLLGTDICDKVHAALQNWMKQRRWGLINDGN